MSRVRNVAKKADRTYKGLVYDSKAEMLRAFELDALKAAGKIQDWERQVRFKLTVRDVLICTMVWDFRVIVNARESYLLEVKGWESQLYQMKLKLFRALYPNVAYKIDKA